MGPLIIDVEASGMGHGSYPIEVGVALPNGEAHCLIIRPEPDWTHWDLRAEALHGISRDTLLRHGQPVKEVAASLNRWLAGKTAYTDAWGNDSSWLALLFHRAEVRQQFHLQALRALISDQQLACWHQVKARVERDSGYTRHRASHDAMILQLTFQQTEAVLQPAGLFTGSGHL